MTPANFIDLLEIESIRLITEGHRSRFVSMKTMRSGPNCTIMLSQIEGTSHVVYRVVESGLIIETGNVATSVPKNGSLATKFRKTTPDGLTPKKSAATKRGGAE